jgi:hypothetical protein
MIKLNGAGNKEESYKITRMTTLAARDNVKIDTGTIRGLNLATVKLTTVQVTKLLL